MKSVYIHIPFCSSICAYCDFCKVYLHKQWVSPYLKSLESEIMDRYRGEEIETLYIGGGTPSSLDIEDLEYLLHLTSLFRLSSSIEFTFECNLNDITREKLILLKKYGVNRLSIGIESLEPDILELLNREASYEDAKERVRWIREVGFSNINFDLIYAVPGQDLSMLKDDIIKLLTLRPEHISTYSLMIEPHTMLSNEHIESISEDLDYEMYHFISKGLLKNGYECYELSNFAKPGYECRHNLVYWNNEEYYGFGLSASGYFDSVRYTNTKNLTKYIKGNYHGEEELLTKKDIMDYEVMLGLRKRKGISITSFAQKYGVSLEDAYPIKPLVKMGYLKEKKGYLFIPREHIYTMNEILSKLI